MATKKQRNYKDILSEIEALTAQKNAEKSRMAEALCSSMSDETAVLLSPLTGAQLGRVMELLEPHVKGCVKEVMAGDKSRVKARGKAAEQVPETDEDENPAIGLMRRDEDLWKAREGGSDRAET